MPLLLRSICGLCLALGAAGMAQAQTSVASGVVFPAESTQARNRLRSIDRLLEPIATPATLAGGVGRFGVRFGPFDLPFALGPLMAEKSADFWDEVEESYYGLLTDSGETLAALPVDAADLLTARTCLQTRRLCHLRLARLPSAALFRYRQRVDTEAHRLLSLGRKNRDPMPLRQLIDEMFCSSFGDEALDLLGDFAFERGEFDEARWWWRLLSPWPNNQATDSAFCFPGSKLDLVRIQAKQILALAFQGLLAQAQDEVERFHRQYPLARGYLASRDGLYSEIVQETLLAAVNAGLANNADAWSTFAGSPGRNHVLTVCPPGRLWEDGPAWKIPLPEVDLVKKAKDKDGPPDRGAPSRRTAFHPIVVGQQVLIANAHSVFAYHLATGNLLFSHDLKHAGLPEIHGTDRKIRLPRFTLTAEGNRVYARLGRQWLAPPSNGELDEPSYLVCLDIALTGDPHRPREIWHVKSQAGEYFEGTPLVRGGRAYVAVSRITGNRVITAIQCFDPLGRLRWSRDVCQVPEFEDNGGPRARQHLLTWAGNQLVYCTHTGAIFAIDPWTGQTLWAVRYTSRGPLTPEGEPSPRDLAPCVYDDGRIFVAPLDSDRIFCLDAFTGRVLWEREGLDVVHLFGSVRGQVYVMTRQGVHSVSVANGLTVWLQPSDGRLAGLGRGLLAGSWLLWPTQDTKLPLRALTLADGRQQKGEEVHPFAEASYFDPTQLRHIPAGNLAFGKDCLIVASADELIAFVPAQRLSPMPAIPDQRPHASAMAPSVTLRHNQSLDSCGEPDE